MGIQSICWLSWRYRDGRLIHTCSSGRIYRDAQRLLHTLAIERESEGTEDHPIIWVAHSLGGILVRQALKLSSDLHSRDVDDLQSFYGSIYGYLRSIYASTYGIMFLGTPHNVTDPAKWRLMLQAISSASMPKYSLGDLEYERNLLKTLPINSQKLLDINLKFLTIYPNRLKVCMVFEMLETDLKGTRSLVVDPISAGSLLPDVEVFGIEATHLAICKFGSENSPGYSNISHTLKSWVQECRR
jgi:hypothetical protein